MPKKWLIRCEQVMVEVTGARHWRPRFLWCRGCNPHFVWHGLSCDFVQVLDNPNVVW